MKKLIYLIVVIVAFGLIVAGCLPVVPPSEQDEPELLPNRSPGVVLNGNSYPTIQAAIDAASPGDTISVGPGTYNEGSLVFNNNNITLIGSDADPPTIITSSNNYGVYVPSGVDYITIKNFTIEEDESNNGNVCLPSGTSRFHLKISHNSGFTLENVKLHGPGKEFSCITGLDLHTVQDVTIKNVEITGYSKNSVGVTAITSGLLFEAVTIDNNGYTGSTGWAGISFYTQMSGGDITNVQFAGINSISNNPMGVFIENVKIIGGGDVHITGTGTTTLSGNLIPLVATELGDLSIVDAYAKDVFNVPVRLEDAFASPPEYAILVSYWHDVTSAGVAATNPLANGNPVIFNLTNGEWYVVEGMSIQAAIDAASPGDTITVAAGTYNERVIINKPLTLQGENRDTTIIDGTGMTADGIPAYGNNGILINPGSAYHMQDVGITISGFTVQNFAVIGAGGGAGIAADVTYQYKNIIISDVIAKDNGLSGLYLPNVLNSNFSNIVVDNNDQIGNGQGYGIHCSAFSSSNTFTNIVAKNHDSTGIFVMQANSNTFDNIISSNNKYGIYYLLGSSGNIVTCSTISDNINNGIKLNAYGTACANNEIHYSDIVGNIEGGVNAVNIGTGITFDATLNWWGDVSGPYHPTIWYWVGLLEITNPLGLGDEVSDYVLYMPWIGMGGFVTGGGTIWSDAGNYRWDVDAEGQANFGFVSKYKKGKNVPDGSTNFVFQAGDLHFHSSSYDWLVVTGSDNAMFKGTGTINGSGEYKFKIWARDGGKGGDDRFRIKIWEEDEDGLEDVVYDNSTDQVIDSGSIVVHTK